MRDRLPHRAVGPDAEVAAPAAPSTPGVDPDLVTFHSVPPVRYPNSYVWFVFVSALDVMLTWAILSRGGSEVNPVARLVIETWALPGAIAFKFSLTAFVIIVCEVVGRRNDWLAHALAFVAIALSAMPVVWSLSLLAYDEMAGWTADLILPPGGELLACLPALVHCGGW